jgi:hypothetical protein
VAAKKHHFLSQFLLRRFAQRQTPPFVWRLDTATGVSRCVPPKSQAARHQYYRLDLPGEDNDGFVEQTLGRIESLAAAAIRRLMTEEPSDDERLALAVFAELQRRRTPSGRRELRFMDEEIARLEFELTLGDAAKFAERMRGRGESESELEALRLRTLSDLRSGRVEVEATPEREIGLMFHSLDTVAATLVAEFDWTALEAPAGCEFVLPDVGLGRYDPTPAHARAGTGWRSSANSQTTIAVDPAMSLLIRPGRGRWSRRAATAAEVADVNLRAYAASDVCYFGRSQNLVCGLRRAAKKDATRIARYRPRPARIWAAESSGRPSGPVTFRGRALDGDVDAQFDVRPRA